jgi:RNA polymerase sigma factor (sigma-70 family)
VYNEKRRLIEGGLDFGTYNPFHDCARHRNKPLDQRPPRLITDELEWDSPRAEYRTLDAAFHRLARENLPAVIKTLTTRQREVFLLRHREGKSVIEIGVILGLTRQAVNQRLLRARERLKRYIRERLKTSR